MQVLIRYSAVLILVMVAVLFAGCGGSEKDPSVEDNNKDRQAILEHWADNIIIPSYENYDLVFETMVQKSNAFTTNPSEPTLNEFRTAWVDAYIHWQTVDLFEFGPADRATLRNFFNIYPADVTGIQSNINDPLANLDVPASYARQGFPALDYLMNGIANDDAAIVALYSTDVNASKRIAYLNRVVTRMNTLLTTVITEWKSSYRETFISNTGLDIGSSMGAVVNAYVLSYERFVRSGKIGIPAAALEVPAGVNVHPEKVEAYYKKDISKSLALKAHQTARNFFNGVNPDTGEEGPSFKSYLIALDVSMGESLASEVDSQFDVVSGKLALLPENFSQQVLTDNQSMLDVFSSMQAIVRMLKVDMTSAMSITITYTDNDGD